MLTCFCVIILLVLLYFVPMQEKFAQVQSHAQHGESKDQAVRRIVKDVSDH